MPDLTLYFNFDVEPGANAGQIAQKLQNDLQELGNVGTAATSTATSRFTGLEVLAAITLAAEIVHQARGISDDLPVIVKNLRAAFAEISHLAQQLKAKSVSIPVEGERKAIETLTDQDYHMIAQDVREAQPG
jgi:hypothetical protein